MADPNNHLRPDLAAILRRIEPNSRALDIGCGDGALMAALRDEKGVDARGIEIDGACVERCVAQGLSVVQGDADRDLAFYPNGAFDYAVLSQTLQTAARPDRMLDELLRVGRRAFVSFPNFAYWRSRLQLGFGGYMPVTGTLPFSWHGTPNIHHCTINDFVATCGETFIASSHVRFVLVRLRKQAEQGGVLLGVQDAAGIPLG